MEDEDGEDDDDDPSNEGPGSSQVIVAPTKPVVIVNVEDVESIDGETTASREEACLQQVEAAWSEFQGQEGRQRILMLPLLLRAPYPEEWATAMLSLGICRQASLESFDACLADLGQEALHPDVCFPVRLFAGRSSASHPAVPHGPPST